MCVAVCVLVLLRYLWHTCELVRNDELLGG